MNPEYRNALLAVLAHMDQLQADAEAILAKPGDAEIAAWAEELREMHVEMQAKVEEKLDRLAGK